MATKKIFIAGQYLVVDEDTGELMVKVSGITFGADIDIGNVNLLNKAGLKIDPATEAKQDVVAARLLNGGDSAAKLLADILAKILAAPATEAKQDDVISGIGATDDALVDAGAVGSVSAKMRRLTTDLDAAVTALQIMDDWDEGDRCKVNLNKLATANEGGKGESVGSSSTSVLSANASRVAATFVNDSDEKIYLCLKATAALSTGIPLNANGGSFEINQTNLYTGEVTAICASGSKTLCVTEV